MVRVIAIIPAFNEADIIIPSIRHLVDQGIRVHLLENWSTDGTYELVQPLVDSDLLTVERFPSDGPQLLHDWRSTLVRVQELASELEAEWFIFQGVDEIHRSAWMELSLLQGIQRVDDEGFNCIDHAVMEFCPVDNDFRPGAEFEKHFEYFEWSAHPAHFRMRNTWKNTGRPVSLVETGGHEARFEGRRVYPFRFLVKHYPIRSQAHGERKVFGERKSRWHPANYAIGWMNHYTTIPDGQRFVRPPQELIRFVQSQLPVTELSDGQRLANWGELAALAVLQQQRLTIDGLRAQLSEARQLLEHSRSPMTPEAGRPHESRTGAAGRLIGAARRIRLRLAPEGSARERAWQSFLRLFVR